MTDNSDTCKPAGGDASATKKAYHHGDLRRSLLDAAKEMIRQEGIGGISMRRLADKVGVSRTALYHHFADKHALLCALAEEGFRRSTERGRLLEKENIRDGHGITSRFRFRGARLARRKNEGIVGLRRVFATTPGGMHRRRKREVISCPFLSLSERFERHIRGYVEFAVENPEYYDLMFGRDIWKSGKPTETLKAEAHGSFRNYARQMAVWQQQGIIPADVEATRFAQVSWSMMHGISRLLIDGIYVDREAMEGMCQMAARVLLKNFT